MQITAVKALNDYFNKDETGKTLKPVSIFNGEIKALNAEEKQELGEGAALALGCTLKSAIA